jgi:PKHD-type hydroxylase
MAVLLQPLGNPTFSQLVVQPLLTPEECASIVERNEENSWEHATIVSKSDAAGVYDPEVRSVSSQPVPIDDQWPFKRLLATLAACNADVFRFRLTGIPLQDRPSILRYQAANADHFRPHTDVGPSTATRKLTYIVQLSDPTAYLGGDLLLTLTGTHVSRELGSLIVFPSFLQHVVSPVIRGTRHVLVGWVHGPTFS